VSAEPAQPQAGQVAATRASDAAGPLRFRIFKRGPWRRAFRLEQAYWDVLERAAEDAGLKIADYVKGLVDAFAETDANQSSMLRVHALAWLQRRADGLARAQEPREILHAALAAPLPCFVISANRALVNFNGEFSSYVVGRAQAASEDDVSKARLSLDVPVDKLIELLSAQPGRAVLCGFTIRTSLAIATGRAKVTLAQPSRRDLVVGYVLPG
jgi:predicted DNA-binding ribbon-helix-helix protein